MLVLVPCSHFLIFHFITMASGLLYGISHTLAITDLREINVFFNGE